MANMSDTDAKRSRKEMNACQASLDKERKSGKPYIHLPSRFVAALAASAFYGLITLFQPKAISQELSLYDAIDISIDYIDRFGKANGYFFTPKILVRRSGQLAPTNCINSHVEGSYFCPNDSKIVIEVNQVERMRRMHGDAAVLYVLSHEYAHWVQKVFTTTRLPDPYNELQADCIAGAILLSSDSNNPAKSIGLNERDVLEIMAAAYSVGGGQVHGTSEQRLSAVYLGSTDGLKGCGVKLDPCPEHMENAGNRGCLPKRGAPWHVVKKYCDYYVLKRYAHNYKSKQAKKEGLNLCQSSDGRFGWVNTWKD